MIKIIHLISSLKRGGRERQLALIVSNTDQLRYYSKIIYFNKGDDSYINEYGLSGLTEKIAARSKVGRLRELNQLLRKEAPEITYSWGNGESISLMLLKPFHNYQFINGSLRHGIRSRRYSHFLRTIILHMSKNIVANSKAGLKANNLNRGRLLYNGIDKIFLAPINCKAEKRKSLTGIGPQIPILISVGNMVPYKDYFSIIQALNLIKNEGYSFNYLILGDGPLRDKIERLIGYHNLNSNIRIIGKTDNVEEYLKVSDIFLHSSKGEGCSNAILEAMAAGLPVLASNTGGTPEIITPKNGLLFEYRNVVQLADLIKYLLNNKDRSIQMGKMSRELILERFTLDKMMKNYYDIINELARR